MSNIYTYGPSGRDEQDFRDAYVECAMWSNEQDELSDSDAEILHAEAYAFLESDHAVRLIQAAMFRRPGYDWASAGHDFYLTRERHGAGFWDRGLGMVGDALTELSHPWGSSDYFPEVVADTEE